MGGCHSPHPQVPTGRWSLDGRALFATSTGGPHLTCTLGRTCFAHGSHSGGQSMRCPIRFLAPRRTRDPPQVVLSLDFAQTWCTTRLRPPVASTAHLIKSQIPQVCSPPSCLPFSPAHHLSAPQMAQVHPHCRASKLSSRRALLLGLRPPNLVGSSWPPLHATRQTCHVQLCVCVCAHARARTHAFPPETGLHERSIGACRCPGRDACSRPGKPHLHSDLPCDSGPLARLPTPTHTWTSVPHVHSEVETE